MSTKTTIGTLEELAKVRRLTTDVTDWAPLSSSGGLADGIPGFPGPAVGVKYRREYPGP